MAENIAEVAKRSDDGGCNDEVAVENSPGGRDFPQGEHSDIEADNTKNGCVREGCRRHKSSRWIRGCPGYGIEVRPVGHDGSEKNGGQKAAELYLRYGEHR